jgi:hypothetical protein
MGRAFGVEIEDSWRIGCRLILWLGRPIEVGGKMEEPAVEEIGRVHGLYMEELERM